MTSQNEDDRELLYKILEKNEEILFQFVQKKILFV